LFFFVLILTEERGTEMKLPMSNMYNITI